MSPYYSVSLLPCFWSFMDVSVPWRFSCDVAICGCTVVCYFLFSVHMAYALISSFLFFSPCFKGKVTITAKPGTKLEIPDKVVIADKVIYAADCLKNLVHRFKKKIGSWCIAIWLYILYLLPGYKWPWGYLRGLILWNWCIVLPFLTLKEIFVSICFLCAIFF